MEQTYKILAKPGHVYFVVDGKVKSHATPESGYGTCQINWIKGKITSSEVTLNEKYGPENAKAKK